jgi:hypothetical protein
MKKDSTSVPVDFQTAANLYSIGQLSIKEASKIARHFQIEQDNAKLSASSEPEATATSQNFNELRGPSLPRLARASVMALANGLGRDTVDPIQDIYEIGSFIQAISDLLTDTEWERAGVFASLANEQAQLYDRDENFVSADAKDLRERIRQAAIEYINNPLNKDPEP